MLTPLPPARRFAPETPLTAVVAARWSVRAFDPDRSVEATDAVALVDAARSAPSAYNYQPWRLWVARRGTIDFDAVLGSLAEYNAVWAWRAGLLIVGIAQDAAPDGTLHPWADYDLGQATALLTIEANARDLGVCQMAGIDDLRLATLTGCAAYERVAIVSAVGYPGREETLDPATRHIQERPRVRRDRGDAALLILDP